MRRAGGDAELDGKAERRSHHRQSNTGVAAGRVENRLARAQSAVALAFTDHIKGCAVFHRAAGVRPLRLGIKFNVGEFRSEAVEAQERRLANQVD